MTRGGTQAEIEAEIGAIREAPDLVKRVFIVTSSLSRADVAQAFAAAANGTPPRAHFVQLYWLLTTYFGASVEMGAVGYVIRSEEHTSELQSLMRISYAVFCLKKKTRTTSTL